MNITLLVHEFHLFQLILVITIEKAQDETAPSASFIILNWFDKMIHLILYKQQTSTCD